MYAQYYRLMKLYALLNELTPQAIIYNPYNALIERVAIKYDAKLKQLFYLLLDGITRMQQVRKIEGKGKQVTVQVTREDLLLVLSLMKDLLCPPKDNHISEGALNTYCFLLDFEEGLSMKELAIKQKMELNTLKHHTLALHKQGYITREWRQGKRQKYYVFKAVRT